MKKELLLRYLTAICVFFAFSGIVPSCQDSCIDYQDFTVIQYDISVNDENRGIFSTDIHNTSDTIRSTTNQFLSKGVQVYGANQKINSGISLMNSAYAKKSCPKFDRSLTFFDPDKLVFTIDQTYDASFVGGPIFPAGTNLAGEQILIQEFLKSFYDKADLFLGYSVPFGTDKEFFKPLNNKNVTFNFVFKDEKNVLFESSFSAYVNFKF